jgi:hypothetical protein
MENPQPLGGRVSPEDGQADGLFTPDGRFHCMPDEDLATAIGLYLEKLLSLIQGPCAGPVDLRIVTPLSE